MTMKATLLALGLGVGILGGAASITHHSTTASAHTLVVHTRAAASTIDPVDAPDASTASVSAEVATDVPAQADSADVSDASGTADVTDASDAADTTDASSASDATDISDTSDAAGTKGASSTSDAADTTDVSDATPTAPLHKASIR